MLFFLHEFLNLTYKRQVVKLWLIIYKIFGINLQYINSKNLPTNSTQPKATSTTAASVTPEATRVPVPLTSVAVSILNVFLFLVRAVRVGVAEAKPTIRPI